MNVISRNLVTLVLHGFGLGPGKTGESHSEILANRFLSLRLSAVHEFHKSPNDS